MDLYITHAHYFIVTLIFWNPEVGQEGCLSFYSATIVLSLFNPIPNLPRLYGYKSLDH
jgi:hypothetical protein